MDDLKKVISIINKTNILLKKRFNKNGLDSVMVKNKVETLTQTDLDANKLITNYLKKEFPNDSIVSEEGNHTPNKNKNTWYIDPLDGSTNFSIGTPVFATCLSRVNTKNEIDFSCTGIPLTNDIFYTTKNKSSFLNEKRITVAKKKVKSKLLIFLGGSRINENKERSLRIIQNIDHQNIRTRTFGCTCYDLVMVARGKFHGGIMVQTNPWDVLPGILLIRNAGGKVTNLKGKEWSTDDNNLIVSNGHCHQELLNLI